MRKEFRVSQSLLERWKRKSWGALIRAICLIIAGVCFIYGFSDDEVTGTIAKDLGADKDLVFLVAMFIAFAVFIYAIISAIMFILCRKKVAALHKSFVILEEDCVSGTTHKSDLDSGTPFTIAYDKIKSVNGTSGNELNLSIYTFNKVFRCLGIPNAPKVAALINQECARRNGKEIPDATAQENKEATKRAVMAPIQPTALICPTCSKPIPENQRFCGFCGAEGVKAKGKIVAPILTDGSLTCPECGESGQRLNRRCCMKCGILFYEDAMES